VKTAALGPSLGAAGSVQRSGTSQVSASNSFQTGLDASWELDLFGASTFAHQAAMADVRAAQDSLAAVRVSLAAEVAVAYIDLRTLQARLALAQSSVAAQQDTLQITRWRVQAGLASSLDQEQGVAASEQTGAQIPALQSSVAQSLSALAVLTGQPPGAVSAQLAATQPVPVPPASWAVTLPADTLRQRPDVRAAESRVAAALARLQQADAQRLPSFRIAGTLGLRALTLGGLTGGQAALGSLLASVSLPVLDGGAALAQVRAQDAALAQARVAYEAAVLAALQDVEDALLGLQGNRDRLVRLQAAVAAATNADLLARFRYEGGLIDYRFVLDAQRTLLSTQDSLTSTRAALSTDHVRLYKALGGGWVPEAAWAAAP
jgi:NodT family efflux transporter outer membrane factor (OMF) lipoprotein